MDSGICQIIKLPTEVNTNPQPVIAESVREIRNLWNTINREVKKSRELAKSLSEAVPYLLDSYDRSIEELERQAKPFLKQGDSALKKALLPVTLALGIPVAATMGIEHYGADCDTTGVADNPSILCQAHALTHPVVHAIENLPEGLKLFGHDFGDNRASAELNNAGLKKADRHWND